MAHVNSEGVAEPVEAEPAEAEPAEAEPVEALDALLFFPSESLRRAFIRIEADAGFVTLDEQLLPEYQCILTTCSGLFGIERLGFVWNMRAVLPGQIIALSSALLMRYNAQRAVIACTPNEYAAAQHSTERPANRDSIHFASTVSQFEAGLSIQLRGDQKRLAYATQLFKEHQPPRERVIRLIQPDFGEFLLGVALTASLRQEQPRPKRRKRDPLPCEALLGEPTPMPPNSTEEPCCVCMENKRTILLIDETGHCNHLCLCDACAKRIFETTRECPLCRQEAVSLRKPI